MSKIAVKKPRQSNMELLRIIAMLLVLLVHANYLSLGYLSTHRQVVAHPFDSYVRINLEAMALICVNLFVLISGYFGIRPKLKGVANLAFQVVFWKLTVVLLVLISGGSGSRALGQLLPGICNACWFIPCYFLLMMVAPALNAYIDSAGRKGLWRFLAVFYGAQTLFGWVFPYWPYGEGYSFVSFIGLYMLGRYIRLYLSERTRARFTLRRSLAVYLITVLAVGAIVFALLYIFTSRFMNSHTFRMFMAYVSPVNIGLAAVLLIGFTHLDFHSRIVNRLAQSAFAVLIFHLDPMVLEKYEGAAKWIYSHYQIGSYALGIVVLAVAVYLFVALIDTLRIWIWGKIEARFD